MNYEKIFEEYCDSNSRPDKIKIIERACLEAQLEVLDSFRLKYSRFPVSTDEIKSRREEIEAKLKAMK